MKKRHRILGFLAILLVLAGCSSTKKTTKNGSSTTSSGVAKSEWVDLTGQFIKNPKHPWTRDMMKLGQYKIEGTITLFCVDSLSNQYVDQSGSFIIQDAITPKTYSIKSGTLGVLDTIVGGTFWFRFDDGGTFRWLSFIRYSDDCFHFAPGNATVKIDGKSYSYYPTSQAARIKIRVISTGSHNQGEDAVAPGVVIGSGSSGSDGSSGQGNQGNDPFGAPNPNNGQYPNAPSQQYAPAQQNAPAQGTQPPPAQPKKSGIPGMGAPKK